MERRTFVFQGRSENAAVKPGSLPRRLDDTVREVARGTEVGSYDDYRIEFPHSFRQFQD